MNIILRDYQIKGIKDIKAAWETNKSVLFQMPTGTGKTTLFCAIAEEYRNKGKKVLIVTHRQELVRQVFERLLEFNLKSEIISSNLIGFPSALIHIASIQTLVRRPKRQQENYSLVIIDEAHHTLARTYRLLWKYYKYSNFLGVTATPIRTTGEGFDDLFDKLIISYSVNWFIKQGSLCDIRYYATHTPDFSDVKIKAGDYDDSELSEVMQSDTIMADLIDSYREFANGKKVIVFAVNRAHSRKIAERYSMSGIPAQYIDTETKTEKRNQIVKDFKEGKFLILCNVNIFTEGFDCPDVDAVQLARPTKSVTLYLQQVGRCMRPHPNKEFGIVLDNAGLWKEHGLPKMNRRWKLEGVTEDICPNKNKIQGLNEQKQDSFAPPIESKAIRLIEIGEIEGNYNFIQINEIEEKFTDKKIETMNNKIEELRQHIEELKEHKQAQESMLVKEAIEEMIKTKSKELEDLITQGKPKRFENTLNNIIDLCYDFIDSNDILIDGDKEEFLDLFVEPKLSNFMNVKVPLDAIKVFGKYKGHTVTALYYKTNDSKEKIYYKNKFYSPSSAANAAKIELGAKKDVSTQGWNFWKYKKDDNTTEVINAIRY